MGIFDSIFGGGDPEPITQTNKVTVDPKFQGAIDALGPQLTNLAQNTPQVQTVGFDPLQTQAQQGIIDVAQNGVTNLSNAAGGANEFLLDPGILDPSSNPHLQGFIDAAVRPLTENFTQSFLPGVRSGAQAAGQVGGSRQGIAEGLGAQAFSRAIGDTTSTIASDAYGQGLNALIQGLQLAPQTSAQLTQPAQLLDTVGTARRDLAVQEQQNEILNQLLPLIVGQDIVSTINATPGATSGTTTVDGAQQSSSSGIGNILGGAATGFSLGGPIGGALGGLAGLFS